MKPILHILIVCLMLPACSIKPYTTRETVRDKDFIIAEILASGMVLGGVTSSRIRLTDETRNKYTRLLEKTLATYPLYGDYTNERLQKAIGNEQYMRLISEYDITEVIPADLYEPIQQGLGHVRYVLFAHIISDHVERRRTHINESGGYNASRSVTISLKVHNLRDKKLVLNTKITAHKSSEAQQISLGGRTSLGSSIQIGFSRGLAGNYPEPPKIEEVLQVVFLGVKEQLPNR